MNAAVQTDQPTDAVDPIASQTTTALAVVTQSITEINAFEAGIAELERQYKGVVFEVGTTAGMDEACKARLAIRKPRYAIQKLAKEAKGTLNNLKGGIDEQEEGYISRIRAVEDPVHEQITNEENRKAAEKEAKRVAEQARVEGIQERINEIRESVTQAAGKPSEAIQEMITGLVALAIDESFAELKQRAQTAKDATLARMRAMHANTAAAENEAQRLVEVRERLDREKAEQDAAVAKERERLAEEQRQAREAAEAEADRVKAIQVARDIEVADQLRLQDEENERARQRNEMALQEINAIHHQLLIADVGRAPYCKGGDMESYDWVIEQTEQWPITQEKFGVLTGSAQKVKDSTLVSLRKGRGDLVRRLQDEGDARTERERLADESRRLNEQKREQERQEQEDERVRKLREERIGGINFIRAIVGMSGSLTTLAELDTVIADTAALVTSADAFGDLAEEAAAARDSTLDILQGRRQLLTDRLELEAAAAISRETVVPPTDPVEAIDGELLSSATLFGNMASAELPPEPDAPSVDDAIITTLDALTLNYNLDDARGKELIVRMGQRVAELAA